MRIGFFDSGIGGLSVLYEALKILPNESYIYYADTANVPYGIKPKDVVKKYIFEAVDFIIKQGVHAVVVACNTATSVAIDDLRKNYSIPIIGMEPAVKPAVEKSVTLEKRVLVTATPLTIKEEKLRNLISRVGNESIVDLLPLPKLVEYAESYNFDEAKVIPYLEEQLSLYNMEGYGTVVLGCTHFPLFKDMFEKILPAGIDLIDGSKGTVNNLKRILESNHCITEGRFNIVYYNSAQRVDDTTRLEKYDSLLRRLYNIEANKKGCISE